MDCKELGFSPAIYAACIKKVDGTDRHFMLYSDAPEGTFETALFANSFRAFLDGLISSTMSHAEVVEDSPAVRSLRIEYMQKLKGAQTDPKLVQSIKDEFTNKVKELVMTKERQ